MAVLELYSHPVTVKYKASICTKGTVFIITSILLAIIPPFLIVYRSQGFWIREDFYREQPQVSFKHEVILVLGMRDGSYRAWSTYSNFNMLQQDHLIIPVVKTREEDFNRDGRNDKLYFDLEMQLDDSQDVVSMELMLFFDYTLSYFSSLHMESLAFIQHVSSYGGAKFTADGDLKLQLKHPLPHKGTDVRYNVPIIEKSSLFVEDYTPSNIVRNYISRNVTTSFECKYPVWLTGRGAGQPFIIQSSVNYPEELIMYVPGFWQTMKMGWIQYFPVLVVFIFLMEKIKMFVFENQIVTAITEKPFVTEKRLM